MLYSLTYDVKRIRDPLMRNGSKNTKSYSKTKFPKPISIGLAPDGVKKAIKKKRNWSAHGPDLLVNFWLKQLLVIHPVIEETFYEYYN